MSSRSRNLGLLVKGVHSAQQKLSIQINRALAPLGLNISRLTILAHFSTQPNKSQTITSVVGMVELNQPAVTKIVSLLIERGWLVAESDAGDARRKLLKITPSGVGIVIQAYALLTPVIDYACSAVDDEALQQLLTGLDKLTCG